MRKTTLGILSLIVLTSCNGTYVPKNNDSMMSKTATSQDVKMMKDDTDTMMEQTSGQQVTTQEMTDDINMMENDNIQKDEMMEKDVMTQSGVYETYSQDKIGKYKTTVLFFYAAWCPSCRAADDGILKGTLPNDVAILKVDYDTQTELKKKYGVTYQHTFVQVDGEGNMISKWAGGSTVEDILDGVK